MSLTFAVRNTAVFLTVSAALFCSLVVLFLWGTYINESIHEGEAYGFVIGQTKEQAYRAITRELPKHLQPSDRPMVEVEVNDSMASALATDPGHRIVVAPVFNMTGFPLFAERDNWEILVNGSYMNVVKLHFCGEELCEIHRHRKYFELP